jgi:hypothetical protein
MESVEQKSSGGFMDILAAIKREERKLEKQLGKLEHQLSGVRAAAKALGHLEREVVSVKKRVLSAAVWPDASADDTNEPSEPRRSR